MAGVALHLKLGIDLADLRVRDVVNGRPQLVVKHLICEAVFLSARLGSELALKVSHLLIRGQLGELIVRGGARPTLGVLNLLITVLSWLRAPGLLVLDFNGPLEVGQRPMGVDVVRDAYVSEARWLRINCPVRIQEVAPGLEHFKVLGSELLLIKAVQHRIELLLFVHRHLLHLQLANELLHLLVLIVRRVVEDCALFSEKALYEHQGIIVRELLARVPELGLQKRLVVLDAYVIEECCHVVLRVLEVLLLHRSLIVQ